MAKIKWKTLIPENIKEIYLSLLKPLVRLAVKWKVNPNTFTTISFLAGCVAGWFMARGQIRLGSGMLLFSGMLDNIDGNLARESGQVTRFGALYDSTLDRYSEVVFFFGMAYHFIKTGQLLTSVAVAVGLGGSLMVSYVRARAEGLGFACNVGWLQRAERLVFLGFGGLIHITGLKIAIWFIAFMANVTAIQRIVHVWREDNNKSNRKEESDVA